MRAVLCCASPALFDFRLETKNLFIIWEIYGSMVVGLVAAYERYSEASNLPSIHRLRFHLCTVACCLQFSHYNKNKLFGWPTQLVFSMVYIHASERKQSILLPLI